MTFSITYAGHSAVMLSMAGKTVAIDPWLEGNPLCPSELKNPTGLDMVVLTHGHADHAGDAVRVVRSTNAKLLATYELAMIMINEGVPSEQVIPMNKGGAVTVDGVKITLTNAFHSSSYDSPTKGTLYAGEACGVLVQTGDAAVYHAGDTCLFSDMQLIGARTRLDLALLPIGDHFTMGPIEAAEAAKLLQPKLVAPIHYKTFDALTGTYAAFSAECRKNGVESVELVIGETTTIGG